MQSLSNGYVHLRVRERRFVGTWTALKKVVVMGPRLFKLSKNFIVPLDHVLIEGQSNKFIAVEFNRRGEFQLIDKTVHSLSRPIQYYEANTAELSDEHIDALTKVITNNGCCQEHVSNNYDPNMYRL